MTVQPIRFEDGAAYEQGMGRWSRPVGDIFLDWVAPPAGARWIDVGCGSGALTGLVAQRCAPAEIQGIDPSDAQLAFARTRPGVDVAAFQRGDAMELPFPPGRFDIAIMTLVIFFVPDPAKGVAEMARVVRPGGTVAAYAWDMLSGGFPFEPIRAELREVGIMAPQPPSISASRMDELTGLWAGAGLEAVETREITVRRTFADFEEFWVPSTSTGSIRPILAGMAADDVVRLKDRVRARLRTESGGGVSHAARANAIKGRVAG
jgi:SAM-dependent methyltransferase